MKQNYHASVSANIAPSDAVKKINRLSAWWGKDFEGTAEKVGDVFGIRFGETWVRFKVVEIVPNKKLVWQVMDCYLPWLADKTEWRNTRLVWELSNNNGSTQIDFTHVGLVPELECYDNCREGWNFYINESLRKWLAENHGVPNGRMSCR
ncbi:MAG TPA: SRPBCC domain-containing protein [Verrucomicrobiae bacterium]|jgi:hypothetical protein|nr:SRPBCC domain-containing protein [Verrucomicrobiae bacterium]HZV33013.1 SRPBCC domain-containing protein [Verrucomicrobiae bacterium]